MDAHNLPTKQNLILTRGRLVLARRGYDLLERKRQVLANELLAVQGQAANMRLELGRALEKALTAFKVVAAEIGMDKLDEIVNGVKASTPGNVPFSFRRLMGVELPVVNEDYILLEISYELAGTTISLDEAVLAWKEARKLIISWAAIENTVYRLQLHIKKTQKRANALGNIVIPKYEARIKYIRERLEERERDDLARIKLAKKKTGYEPG
ncbi:MAG: V-type ATP synthase subunit D [Defluviitaleaceae bacterium]|nr:V-type ATP synthase subunit D [Defluviitaleaceae bacterium]